MHLRLLQRFGSTAYRSATLKASRHALDVFESRVRQAATEPTLIAFGQRLCSLMDVEVSATNPEAMLDFLTATNSDSAPGLLRWVRANHTLFAVLCAARYEDADEAMKDITIEATDAAHDEALPRRPYHIGIRAKCLTPLSHGADGKSGNATLFRRMSVLGKNGTIMDLPYYAGNAIRGQMRDLLADHFTAALGLTVRRDRPPYELWFFHALYAGGALEEGSAATKAITKEMGDHGAIRSDGVRQFRDTLPVLSLLGCAMGSRIISGHADFGDWRPVCREWGNGGEQSKDEMTEWLFGTRREDHEDHEEHHGMIHTTEVLKPGTMLEGGIDLRLHVSDLSRSALGVGLRALQTRGWIGAQNRCDLGMVEITVENAPDPEPYETYLRENREAILDYLATIGAIGNARAFSNR